MNKTNIVLEQALHGYSQGHHLLASSVELSKGSQRIMSILSDLSGPETCEGFSEYLTGYPLVEDCYYALGKTWYALEMNRPGCVWTHTILIKFDELKKIKDSKKLLNYFNRPYEDFSKNKYSTSIEISTVDDYKNFITSQKSYFVGLSDNLSKDENGGNIIKNLIYFIYSNDGPIILESDSAERYQELILRIWENQWLGLRKSFSFCTGSLANRKIGKHTFDVQVVPDSISRSIGRSDPNSVILDNGKINSYVPVFSEWASQVADSILYNSNQRFKEFLEDFGSKFIKREYFAKLSQLYVEINAKDRIKSIDQYLAVAKNIFKENDNNFIIEQLVDQSLKGFPNKWFGYSNSLSFLLDLSTTRNLVDFSLEGKKLGSQLEVLLNPNNDEAKQLFRGLISRNLNQLGELLLKEFSRLIKPEQLSKLTDMDVGACNVLVSLNAKFALVPEVWKQSKDFQSEIIDCVKKSASGDDLKEKIILAILENSSESLYEQVFNAFGEISINVFLDWCKSISRENKEKIKDWMQICTYNPDVCIKWILSTENLDGELLVSVISIFDPYSDMIKNFGVGPWVKVFEHLNYEILDSRSRLILAQFFLPLILMSNEVVPNDFVRFSFDQIYKELENSGFDYKEWIKLEPLLPLISWYSAWDKCKRLRMAFEQKGYLLA